MSNFIKFYLNIFYLFIFLSLSFWFSIKNRLKRLTSIGSAPFLSHVHNEWQQTRLSEMKS